MNTEQYSITLENPDHAAAVEALAAEAFGPGRFARSAFRLREGRESEPSLSFVAVDKSAANNALVGSVKLTKIRIGGKTGLLLGPLIVTPAQKNSGIGAALMEKAVSRAKQEGYDLIILVGDEPYYRRFGFIQIPRGQISLPGPADPARILACELKLGSLTKFSGKAEKF